MVFSSTSFIYLFLPVVLVCYYLFFRKNRLLQNIFLLAASLIFYAWGEPVFILIMATSIIANWALGLLIGKDSENKSIRKMALIAAVAFNLSILFVFKYLAFSLRIVNSVFRAEATIPQIALPIGISFFSFQALSYVIDVYRRKAAVQKNILNVGLYISFFPQLIAGPIVRYETISEEIIHRKETWNDFGEGFSRFIIGLSKKVLIANGLGVAVDRIFNSISGGTVLSAATCWFGALAYTLQIFFDFSGYSDMAIGLGRMFGFHFLENFNYPYVSTSVTEFWRRWHISLGTWFRDYVYIPLGGSRVAKPRRFLNLFIVWLLTGLWHGADYTFFVWGLLHFAVISLEKLNEKSDHRNNSHPISVILKWFYTMLFVTVGWVLFRSDTIGDALKYIRSMFCLYSNTFTDRVFSAYFSQYAVLLVIGIIFSTPLIEQINRRIKPSLFADILRIIVHVGLFVLSVASIVGSSYNPFIYFNF